MVGITNGLGTIYTADADRPVCSYELPQEVILEDSETLLFEGCE
jgi:hypothetical protein